MKISRTGLLCLVVLGTSILVHAQARRMPRPRRQTSKPAPPQQAPAQQPPAAPPAQQPSNRRTAAATTASARVPACEAAAGAAQRAVTCACPAKPVGTSEFTGWLPIGTNCTDKGHAADFTDLSKLQLAGKIEGLARRRNRHRRRTAQQPPHLLLLYQAERHHHRAQRSGGLQPELFQGRPTHHQRQAVRLQDLLRIPHLALPGGRPPFSPEDAVAGAVRHDENGLRRAHQVGHSG